MANRRARADFLLAQAQGWFASDVATMPAAPPDVVDAATDAAREALDTAQRLGAVPVADSTRRTIARLCGDG
jgi:hypothetical protein